MVSNLGEDLGTDAPEEDREIEVGYLTKDGDRSGIYVAFPQNLHDYNITEGNKVPRHVLCLDKTDTAWVIEELQKALDELERLERQPEIW